MKNTVQIYIKYIQYQNIWRKNYQRNEYLTLIRIMIRKIISFSLYILITFGLL